MTVTDDRLIGLGSYRPPLQRRANRPAPQPIPLPSIVDLQARVDSVKELLLFFRVGKRPNAAAVEALIFEAMRRLNRPASIEDQAEILADYAVPPVSP